MAGPGMLSFSRTEKYCSQIADEILQLRGEKVLIDFKIHVKDDVIPCSKFVMAVHSPMLRAMLTSNMAEVAKQEMRLDHIDLDIMKIILDYMYCENVSFHKDQLMDLIAAADYLQMTDLKEMCLDEVPGILEPSNVIEWWNEAEMMNYNAIKEQCEETIIAKFNLISQQNDFLNMELDKLHYYVSDICCDTVNSDATVDAVLRWVSHEEERVTLLKDLIHKVQLNKCSDEGIKAIIKTHIKLLDKTPMVYKLLFNALTDLGPDTVVVVGGVETDGMDYTIPCDSNKVCWKVDKSNEIVHLCDIPPGGGTVKFSLCVIPQGFVITGGIGKPLCLMFMAPKRQWVTLQDLLERRYAHGSICIKNVLYILGGYVGKPKKNMECCDSVYSMVLKYGKWKNKPSLPLAVRYPKVTNIANSVYLLDAENSKKLWRLDADDGEWNELAPLPVENYCFGVSMVSARGRLFVAGGRRRVCAWYRPNEDTWCTGQQPLSVHRYGALTHYNNKLLLLGGNCSRGTDDVEEYNIDEDKWSLCNYKIPKSVYLHHAAVLKVDESSRKSSAGQKRLARKTSIPCPNCNKTFRAQIGLFSHMRTHKSASK